MLWYLLVLALFGAKNVFAFQIVSALAVTALVAVLWRFGTIWGLMRWPWRVHRAGDDLCAVVDVRRIRIPERRGLLHHHRGGRGGGRSVPYEEGLDQRAHDRGRFLICGIGIVFKSTYQIVILAAILAVIFAVWRNRRFWQLIVAFVSAGGAFVISKLPVSLVQHWTGQDFGKGMPMISWIALGLGEPG